MPTVIDLGQKVKTKYPEYADMSDLEVGKKVKAKYPEYSDFSDVEETKAPEKSLMQKVGQRVLNTGSAVASCVDLFTFMTFDTGSLYTSAIKNLV